MQTKAATHEESAGHAHRAGATNGEKAKKESSREGVRLDTLLTEGSWQRIALGVTAAAGGGLLAAALLGVGPAALAGTAGYLTYRGMARHRPGANASHRERA